MTRKAILAGAALLSSAVAAQGPPPEKNGKGDTTWRICRVTYDTGSRLQSRRVCLTEAEGAAQRLQTRTMIDRAQTKQTNPGSGFGEGGM
jgi:hypothetical protein